MLREELWCHADAGMLLHAAADLPDLLQLVLKMGVDVNGGISGGHLSEAEARHIRANYGAKLSMIDHLLGPIHDALD